MEADQPHHPQTHAAVEALEELVLLQRRIEVEDALERVRARALAMHNSDDLSSAAIVMFTELKKLGIQFIRSGVGLLTKKSRKVILYSATASDEGDNLSLLGWAMLQDHPV